MSFSNLHLSSSAAHGLLVLPLLGSGSNQNSILDLTFFIWEALGTLLTWDTHLASTPACSWDGHTACLAQVGNHQAMKQEKKTKTAPQAHVRTPWVRPVRPAGGRAAGWAGQGISERYGGHVFFHELKTSLLLSLITHKRGPHPCKGGQKSKTQEFIVPGQHRSAEKSDFRTLNGQTIVPAPARAPLIVVMVRSQLLRGGILAARAPPSKSIELVDWVYNGQFLNQKNHLHVEVLILLELLFC